MEAFGRSVAVLFGTVSLVLLLFFFRTVSVQWQKNETVYSIGKAYAERVVQSKIASKEEWQLFQTELERLGDFEAELTVYERKRYEGEEGRLYLYEERVGPEEKELSVGSYVRLVIKEKSKGILTTFLYGDSCFVITGGRIA